MVRLNVLHIIAKLELGGAQQNTLYTLSHLNKQRFHPTLVTGRQGILVEEAKKVISATQEADVLLAVGLNTRRMARYRKAKELIEQGAIGEIILAEASSSGEAGMKLTPEMWRWYRKESPGGPLMSFTIHYADCLNHLVGPMKTVKAFTSKVCGEAGTEILALRAYCFSIFQKACRVMGIFLREMNSAGRLLFFTNRGRLCSR